VSRTPNISVELGTIKNAVHVMTGILFWPALLEISSDLFLKFITTAQTVWREFEIKINSFFMFDLEALHDTKNYEQLTSETFDRLHRNFGLPMIKQKKILVLAIFSDLNIEIYLFKNIKIVFCN
jgi:hypothetical protein